MIREEQELQDNLLEDISITEPNNTKSQARADFGKLLTIILLKIGNATLEGHFGARKSGIELIEDYVYPYCAGDPIYNDAIKEAEKTVKEAEESIPLHKRNSNIDVAKQDAFLRKKLQALMGTMQRAGLLGVSLTDYKGTDDEEAEL